jgi:hypothetical protein
MKRKINSSSITSELSTNKCWISNMKFGLSQRIPDSHNHRITHLSLSSIKHSELTLFFQHIICWIRKLLWYPITCSQSAIYICNTMELRNLCWQKDRSTCTWGKTRQPYILEFKGLHEFLKRWGTDQASRVVLAACFMMVSCLAYSSTLKAEEISSSE